LVSDINTAATVVGTVIKVVGFFAS
jgi:hypothetical protein